VNANTTIYATFELTKYKVEVTPKRSNTEITLETNDDFTYNVTLDSDSKLDYGTAFTVTAPAYSGRYYFKSWSGTIGSNNISASTDNPLVFVSPAAASGNKLTNDATITAEFDTLYEVKTTSNSDSGTVAITGTSVTSDLYKSGDNITLTATASTGYRFVKWVDGSGQDISGATNVTYTISSLRSDQTVKPVFVKTYGFDFAITVDGTTTTLASLASTVGTIKYKQGNDETFTDLMASTVFDDNKDVTFQFTKGENYTVTVKKSEEGTEETLTGDDNNELTISQPHTNSIELWIEFTIDDDDGNG
jgi:hypothetical protein